MILSSLIPMHLSVELIAQLEMLLRMLRSAGLSTRTGSDQAQRTDKQSKKTNVCICASGIKLESKLAHGSGPVCTINCTKSSSSQNKTGQYYVSLSSVVIVSSWRAGCVIVIS